MQKRAPTLYTFENESQLFQGSRCIPRDPPAFPFLSIFVFLFTVEAAFLEKVLKPASEFFHLALVFFLFLQSNSTRKVSIDPILYVQNKTIFKPGRDFKPEDFIQNSIVLSQCQPRNKPLFGKENFYSKNIGFWRNIYAVFVSS